MYVLHCRHFNMRKLHVTYIWLARPRILHLQQHLLSSSVIGILPFSACESSPSSSSSSKRQNKTSGEHSQQNQSHVHLTKTNIRSSDRPSSHTHESISFCSLLSVLQQRRFTHSLPSICAVLLGRVLPKPSFFREINSFYNIKNQHGFRST